MASAGTVKAKFKGRRRLLDLNRPNPYQIEFEGQGGAAGASVGGKIVQIRQRLVDMAAQKMAAEFFSNFEAQLLALHPETVGVAADETPAEIPICARLCNWLRRMAMDGPAKATDA